ncbi:hypothetical protein K504DRAFT_382174, partial [Pleomassaria siparia CBS 279.74]
ESCLHPKTSKPYLRFASNRRNNSPNPKAFRTLTRKSRAVFTHGLIIVFVEEEDRDYYSRDSVHLEFRKWMGEMIQNVQVLDHTSGKL